MGDILYQQRFACPEGVFDYIVGKDGKPRIIRVGEVREVLSPEDDQIAKYIPPTAHEGGLAAYRKACMPRSMPTKGEWLCSSARPRTDGPSSYDFKSTGLP